MGLPETFVLGLTACMDPGAPGFAFPGIADPGLGNLALGCFASTFAGITYLLNFLPPSPTALPSVPSVDIFLQAMLSALKLPANYPGFSLDPITIPGVGNAGACPYDISGELKLIYCCVMLPFKAIKGIIEKIISDLTIEIPSIETLVGIFNALVASVGLSDLSHLATCLAGVVFALLTSAIPV